MGPAFKSSLKSTHKGLPMFLCPLGLLEEQKIQHFYTSRVVSYNKGKKNMPILRNFDLNYATSRIKCGLRDLTHTI
jgi:hypothetical protein